MFFNKTFDFITIPNSSSSTLQNAACTLDESGFIHALRFWRFR
ncbi:XRE family transcriptional regulator [Enterobacter hormaechei ATCC 49162]|nr:XRE family transcriptional regulator [Enterobacter hormaechei ATCC 49162]